MRARVLFQVLVLSLVLSCTSKSSRVDAGSPVRTTIASRFEVDGQKFDVEKALCLDFSTFFSLGAPDTTNTSALQVTFPARPSVAGSYACLPYPGGPDAGTASVAFAKVGQPESSAWTCLGGSIDLFTDAGQFIVGIDHLRLQNLLDGGTITVSARLTCPP